MAIMFDAQVSVCTALPPGWMISSRRMPCWRIDADHTLELLPLDHPADGQIRWAYRLAYRNKTIFAARDMRSPMGSRLTTDEYVRIAREVLMGRTVVPGDIEAPYFDSYNPAQIAWRDAHAERLAVYAMDTSCGACGSPDHIAPACTRRESWNGCSR